MTENDNSIQTAGEFSVPYADPPVIGTVERPDLCVDD